MLKCVKNPDSPLIAHCSQSGLIGSYCSEVINIYLFRQAANFFFSVLSVLSVLSLLSVVKMLLLLNVGKLIEVDGAAEYTKVSVKIGRDQFL
jgi:hypothetical protein